MSRLHRWLLKTARTIHLYLTLFGLTLLVFFAVTGFMLNHEGWFASNHPHSHEIEGTIPVELLGSPAEEEQGQDDGEPSARVKKAAVPADRLAIVELLRKDFGAVGPLETFEERPNYLSVRFTKPGRLVEAEIDRENGQTKVRHETRGTVGIMLDLHRGKASGRVWSLVIDGVCIMVLVVASSGLVLWSSLRGRGRYSSLVLVGGIAFSFVVYFLFVP